MAETTFDHGSYETVEHTPTGGNVAAGQVVLLGNTTGLTCGIAHHDIVNNTLGALGIGGFHQVVNLNNAANYAKVWWDDTNNKVTTVSTNNALFGFISEGGGAGANTTAVARHFPFV
jgi:hypothetical protein